MSPIVGSVCLAGLNTLLGFLDKFNGQTLLPLGWTESVLRIEYRLKFNWELGFGSSVVDPSMDYIDFSRWRGVSFELGWVDFWLNSRGMSVSGSVGLSF